MPLMSIDQAAKHLRLPAEFDEEDLELKVELASAIILDYLKARAHTTVTVTSSSVASPTVITTSTAHGFRSGQRVTISGHEDSTPSLDGTYTLSNATAETFTVPVAVTVSGSGGTALVQWDEAYENVPGPVLQAAFLMLTHIYENRGHDQKTDKDLWSAIERILARRRDPAYA